MRFSYITILSAIASVAFADYCNTSISECDINRVPDGVRSGSLKLIAIVDNQNASIKYKVAGDVVIKNDCEFEVQNFYAYPALKNAGWYCAKNGSKEGTRVSDENNPVPQIDENQPTTLSYNSNINPFCHASLLDDCDVMRLMDQNFQTIAEAQINGSGSSSTGSSGGSTSTSGSGTGSGNGSTSGSTNGSTGGTSTTTSNNGKTSDATTSKWSMGLLALSSVAAFLLA